MKKINITAKLIILKWTAVLVNMLPLLIYYIVKNDTIYKQIDKSIAIHFMILCFFIFLILKDQVKPYFASYSALKISVILVSLSILSRILYAEFLEMSLCLLVGSLLSTIFIAWRNILMRPISANEQIKMFSEIVDTLKSSMTTDNSTVDTNEENNNG